MDPCFVTNLQFLPPDGCTLLSPLHLLQPLGQAVPQLTQPLRPPARSQVTGPLPGAGLLGRGHGLISETSPLKEEARLQVVLLGLEVVSVTSTDALNTIHDYLIKKSSSIYNCPLFSFLFCFDKCHQSIKTWL